MAQIPCPEITCLGFKRQRPVGQSISQALQTPSSSTCCQHLAVDTVDWIRCYLDQSFEVLTVLGGNEQSPACAVHTQATGETQLNDQSGIFMQALAAELAHRGLQIQFRRIRDTVSDLIGEDLNWLRERIY